MDSIPRITITPLPYQPAYEIVEAEEEETKERLLRSLHKISDITYQDSGHGLRSVHAKSHGLLLGKMRVLDGLPPELAQGIFAKALSYPVVMRLSTTPGDVLDDHISTPRGMAVKVIGVEGERLDSSPGDVTQDFVMVNGPLFPTPSAKKFVGGLELLASTTDKAPGLKKALSSVLRGAEKALEAVGAESATLKSLGGHPVTHILGETFYSQAPILFGPYMAKLQIVPVASTLQALTGKAVDLHGKPDGMRESVVAYFADQGAEWEVRVQLCTDLDSMPIEDASLPWSEQQSPFFAVARITAPPQAGWNAALSKAVDDGMAFNPWHGIAAHRPIGSIMRVRKVAYQLSSRLRAERNGVALVEPKNLDDFPG
ncbi:hypothetical protein AAKU55_002370 [Oxalobacteraceae bacterium GrIS 1.11]